jgi:hypothetical protein
MVKKLVSLLIVGLFLSSCSQNSGEQHGEILYYYTGELMSLVDQRKEPINKEEGITYTMTMDHFHPTEDDFDKANSTYPEGYEGTRHVNFTARTKVYIQKGNKKTLTTPSDLDKYTKTIEIPRSPETQYQKLEVWITPYKKNDWYIEAVEVVVLQD